LRYITILLFSIYLVHASPLEIEKEIYKIIIQSIFPHKKSITIWTDNPKEFDALIRLKNIKFITNPKYADIVFVSRENSFQNIPPKKIIFVNSYILLKKHKNEAIGGFFWQKGRPNIVFLRQNLQIHHINLSPDFQKYIEDEL